MMTAKINFITNNLLVDMTCRENELRNSLQNIGILIVPSMIYLDNRRTLQIQLNANDEVGEIVKTLINTERDTLGTVQRLCRSVYCLNSKHRAELIEMIENGEKHSITKGMMKIVMKSKKKRKKSMRSLMKSEKKSDYAKQYLRIRIKLPRKNGRRSLCRNRQKRR